MKNEIFWSIWMVAMAAGGFIIWRKILQGRQRQRFLKDSSQTIALESLEKFTEEACFIYTNFGYGSEFWYLPNGDESLDFRFRSYKHGLLILPTPKFKVAEDFCVRRNIKMKTIWRKF